jgi:hypothetical protein
MASRLKAYRLPMMTIRKIKKTHDLQSLCESHMRFEVRQPAKHTKDVLADALRKVGLEEMAKKAEMGYYHDFLSPLDMPEIQLVNDLREASMANPAKDQIIQLAQDVMDGKHDANKVESDEWAKSPEGQAAYASLMRMPKK